MINAEGENVDLYIPRKCSWTNRLIEAKDHASVQINVGHLDQTGVYNGQYTVLALSGYVRNMVSVYSTTQEQEQEQVSTASGGRRGLGRQGCPVPSVGAHTLDGKKRTHSGVCVFAVDVAF